MFKISLKCYFILFANIPTHSTTNYQKKYTINLFGKLIRA